MLTTELCVFYISKSFFGTEITAYAQSDLVLYIQGACSKLLYFFAAYVISKLLVKENRIDLKVSKTSFLFLLPVASLLLLIGMAYSTENYPVNNYIYILFSVATILLIYSNLLVFWVHETIIKEQHKNMELQLQKQKNEIDVSYYQILQNHYDNSSILIHDIKRHLLSIKELSSSKNCDAINTYIDNLYDSYQINYLKKYSNNKLVNVIINRYAMACKDNNIDFYCDIRDIDFSFISDNDLTAILDNILENAFEACKNSENKTIDLKINQTNKNFISINLWNTTSIIPNIKYGKLATSKENKLLHGFGIRSIERIAKKHNGNVDFSFDKEKMIFTFNVILKNT